MVREAGWVSKTMSAGYRGFCFWVLDVCASLLFAEMATVASEPAERPEWLASLEGELRVHAVVGADLAVPLDEWCDGHEEQFLALVAEAGRRLAGRGAVTARQAAAWVVLNGAPVIWRGQDTVDTAPVVAFAEALAAIIRGTYPQAPPGHWWYFGHPGEVRTIEMRG